MRERWAAWIWRLRARLSAICTSLAFWLARGECGPPELTELRAEVLTLRKDLEYWRRQADRLSMLVRFWQRKSMAKCYSVDRTPVHADVRIE